MPRIDKFDQRISEVIDNYRDLSAEKKERILQKHAQNMREKQDAHDEWAEER